MNLVLGTDPIEGSSLAISILESFSKQNTLTIATTHYPEIKNYALVTNGFENASCEFDLEHLKPTYRLLIGVPGRSNAFEISKKLGLQNSIIERAKNFMNSNEIHIEELLKNIYDDKLLIENEKQNIQKQLKESENLKHLYEEKNNHLHEKELSIIENAKLEARKILLNAKEEASHTIQEINKIYENVDNNSIKQLNNIRNTLNTSIKNNSSISNVDNSKVQTPLKKEEISIGMNVYVRTLKQYGIVTTLVNKSNQVQVKIGNAKIMIPLSNIEKTNKTTKPLMSTSSYKTNKSKTLSSEINVIGNNVEEAVFVIDKYLDDCAIAKLNTVRIVHGKGTGALKKGIHFFLKNNSHVKAFRLGTFGEGEDGVTIVELK